MSALDEFKAAYNRLKDNKPVICKKNAPINLSNIAKEAGKTRSSLRKGRGFDEFINQVKLEIESNELIVETTSYRRERKIDNIQKKLKELKKENSLLKSQNLSLLMSNYSLEQQLKKHAINPKKVVEFTMFNEKFIDIDVENDF